MQNQRNPSKNRDFSAFFAAAIPLLVLGIKTGNPAFLGSGLTFLIFALSESRAARKKRDKGNHENKNL
jgi:hypothetical protein